MILKKINKGWDVGRRIKNNGLLARDPGLNIDTRNFREIYHVSLHSINDYEQISVYLFSIKIENFSWKKSSSIDTKEKKGISDTLFVPIESFFDLEFCIKILVQKQTH